ncbi:hypothetical protein RhiJN_17516 [Ceratobasidium sp. AG-Ba]|nr:hypothetical protein RhiJN_17516 [Ceratobasidium sp. AG-Ba]
MHGKTSLAYQAQLAYVEARGRQPGVGRRQLKLQIVDHFWRLSKAEKTEAIQKAATSSPVTSLSETDPDPNDIPGLADSRAIGTRGIVVRTHFDSAEETAWNNFLSSLEDLERRSLDNIADTQMEEDDESESDEEVDDVQDNSGDAVQSDVHDADMEGGGQPSAINLAYATDAIFVVVDPTRRPLGETSQALLSNASNIKLLRIFNDASIAPCPTLPPNAPKRVKPEHRLIDQDGFQEIYSGPRIWVWDQQSAKDQTLRLVSSRVFVYGDSTADSWRARATHMWDLQVNMDAGMRIDFSGGVGGGWDMNERARNMKDAVI